MTHSLSVLPCHGRKYCFEVGQIFWRQTGNDSRIKDNQLDLRFFDLETSVEAADHHVAGMQVAVNKIVTENLK